MSRLTIHTTLLQVTIIQCLALVCADIYFSNVILFVSKVFFKFLYFLRLFGEGVLQLPSGTQTLGVNYVVETSLVPRPPPFFVLQFAFSIIHGSGRA